MNPLHNPLKSTLLNERIVLNVSGLPFETWSWTLSRFPNTLLGNPLRRSKYFNFIHNEYFFERHRQSFESILYYYQSNGKFLHKPLSVSSEVFFDEIVFFELGEEVINKYKKDEGYLIDTEANISNLPKNKFKRLIWLLYEYPHSSIYARMVAITSVIVIVISIALFCIETLPEPNSSGRKIKGGRSVSSSTTTTHIPPTTIIPIDSSAQPKIDHYFFIETLCIIWFSSELILRFFATPDKRSFIRHTGNIIDFFSILPYFLSVTDMSEKFSILRIIRLVRVFRIFKLARHFKGLQILAHTLTASANELMLLVFFIIVGVILFSSTIYFAELDHPMSDFHSIPEGFWYAIITMTTVGYGEIVPKSVMGKVVGSFCAIAGVLTIALPVPIVVSHFQFFYSSNQVVKKLNKETLKLSFRKDAEIENEYKNYAENDERQSELKNQNSSTTTTRSTNFFMKCFKSNKKEHVL